MYSVFVYILYTVKIHLTYGLHLQVGSSPVFTLSKNIDILEEMTSFTRSFLPDCHFPFVEMLTLRMILFLKECLCSLKVYVSFQYLDTIKGSILLSHDCRCDAKRG